MLQVQGTETVVCLRATKTHTTGGQAGYRYRLMRSERSADKVRQKTLLNLGTDYQVPKENWKQVADFSK